MSAFHDQFVPDPDPEMADKCRLWDADKPLFREAVVKYAPPYPDYPKLKLGRRKPSCDPSCPSARDTSESVMVAMYCAAGEGFGDRQERCWNFIGDNATAIESNLRRKLFAQHQKAFKRFLEEDLPEDRRTQNYWKKIQDDVQWGEETAVDCLYKLVRVGLADTGLDDCGFSSFEFQAGWDLDHGTAILMHKDNVLAASGMEEFMSRGSDLIQAVRNVQRYDFDDGDFSLLE